MNRSGISSLKVIAEECGVSAMTVSRALNPEHRNRMSRETRERILASIEKHGYVPNPAASRLKRQKTDTITLIVRNRVVRLPESSADFDAHFGVMSWAMIRNIITTARQHGCDVKVEPQMIVGHCEEVVERLHPQLTDGVIIHGFNEMKPIIDHAQEHQIPFVIMCEDNPEQIARSALPAVVINRHNGLTKAFDYLWGQGHTQIAFIGTEALSSQANLTAFTEYFTKKKVFDSKLIHSVKDFFDLRQLVPLPGTPPPFSAAVCGNDTMAEMLTREFRLAGFKVPGDVAIIGQDCNPVYRGEGRVNPTTVTIPRARLGEAAVELLMDKMEGEGDGKKSAFEIIDTEFVLGGTA